MAAGGTDAAFGLAANRSAKPFVDNCAYHDMETLSEVFLPVSSGKQLSLLNLHDHISRELNRVSATVVPPIRDGVLGMEEVRVSGAVLFDVDRLGVTSHTNFSTVKGNVCVYKGRWMYEVLLGSKGLMQLGWCSLGCKFNHSEGVGDTPHSFAYDGNRIKKWNMKAEKYGEAWLTGDVITCAIDCDEGIVTFYRNGVSLGQAYDTVSIGPNMAYFPAISLSRGESVRLNFGSTPFIYPVEGYQPLELAPEAALKQSQLLLTYLSRLLPRIINSNNSSSTTTSAEQQPHADHLLTPPDSTPIALSSHTPLCEISSTTTNVLLLTHILEHLIPLLKIPYVMQGAFIPFIKDILDGDTSTSLKEPAESVISRLIQIMWGLLEDHEMKLCLEYWIQGLLTLYRFANPENDYSPQKAYLQIFLLIMKNEASRKYALKWILFDKMKFPLFIYVKPPDDKVLKHIVPVVWWKSNHTIDKETDERNKQSYYKSCDQLHQHIKQLEDVQVAILKELLSQEETSKTPSSRSIFLHKFRSLLEENVNERNVVQAQQCSLPVLLALYHRFVRTLRELFEEKSISPADTYVPVEDFINKGSEFYFDMQRVGGLPTHLYKVHEKTLSDAKLGTSKTTTRSADSSPSPGYGNSGVTDKELLEMLDGAMILYAYGAHKQLQKMSSVLSETVDCYVTALDDCIDKLDRCPPENVDVHLELERSRQVFEEKVIEQSRHLSWLIIVINSSEKMSDVAWLFDAALQTVENATQTGQFFDFMPEFYVNVCVDAYMALRTFFKLSQVKFSQLENYESLLDRYGTFLAQHFADTRIVNVDARDSIVQSLACFVCYKSSLRVLESLDSHMRNSMVKSLLAPYENRAWAQTNWILARLWKGDGFGFRFIHLPHLAPAKHQTQEIGAASLQKPCPSRVLQQTVSEVLTTDNKLATQFINSVLNQLNWAFSEFVGMIQELQQLSSRSERSFVEMRQLKICATCFDISVGLLRVIEMITRVAPSLFLDTKNTSSELLLSRLYQSLCLILNRVASTANVFDTILSLNLPGMETVDHFPIITAILGVLVALVFYPDDQAVRERSASVLLKEPGFQLNLLSNMICDEMPSPGAAAAPTATDKKQFSLKQYNEINTSELESVENLVQIIHEQKRVHRDSKSDIGDDDSMCTICYARENSAIFLPCRHTSCRSCITHQMLQNSRCFYCMSEIEKVTDLDDVHDKFTDLLLCDGGIHYIPTSAANLC